ncbi:hypothetical protein Taro_040070 [Colocasia esculenta]|uniref:Uncharacterized protein n=1 Tax=Colocasia esculenta TaxID=4460 RepID=A0A843WXG2_COLES|nr:hypothetical protein [Colocasia esculenta]
MEWLENITGLTTLYNLSKTEALRDRLHESPIERVSGEGSGRQGGKDPAQGRDEERQGSDGGAAGEGDSAAVPGMYDLRDGVVSTEAWLRELEWEELEDFQVVQQFASRGGLL